MNEWFKKLLDKVKELWAKWTLIQKVILIGIVAVLIIALIFIGNFSSAPSNVALYSQPITDEVARDNIIYFLDNNNIETTTDSTGKIYVKDKAIARQAKTLLLANGLQPSNVDPWDVFNTERWTTTDLQQNTNLQLALQNQLKQYIESLSDIDRADVIVAFPKTNALFAADRNPVSATVTLYPKPGKEEAIKSQVKGIERIIQFGISGLSAENISITDGYGNILNDFENLQGIEKVDVTNKEQQSIANLEAKYRADVLTSLQATFGADRVRDLNLKIDMDFSEITSEAVVYSPITIKEDNPDTPYDDSEYVNSLVLSAETVTKTSKGTVYNPEGPSGVEGQNPPVYSDMSNMYTITEEKGEKVNNVVNTSQITTTRKPKIDKMTVSVNIDGKWKLKVDEKGDYVYIDNEGHREWEYIPISQQDLDNVVSIIRNAIGNRPNDSITVANIAFDRTKEHEALDAEYARTKQAQQTILYIAIGIVVVLLAFILFRFVNRQIEKKRKEKEAELLRRQQAEQDRILQAAEHESMEVTMSVEERERAELQEHAVALAKEHPEDVAMLIRTWLMEE